MAQFKIVMNMEAVKDADMDYRKGVKVAGELGYKYIEPFVHTGWGLMSEVGYYHSWSMEEDPLLMKEIAEDAGVQIASLSGHSPLMKPEAAVERLTKAIVYASHVGCDFVNSDEMIKPEWMNDEEAHQAMKYTLTKAEMVAARHKKYICIEPHGIYTKTVEGLLKIVNLVDSPWMKINWDTGNAYLQGNKDEYEALKEVRDLVYHIHAKDISIEHSEEERGEVTGTPVGCACGDGVYDWEKVLEILEPVDRVIPLSVECGTIEDARRSIAHLKDVVGDRLVE